MVTHLQNAVWPCVGCAGVFEVTTEMSGVLLLVKNLMLLLAKNVTTFASALV